MLSTVCTVTASLSKEMVWNLLVVVKTPFRSATLKTLCPNILSPPGPDLEWISCRISNIIFIFVYLYISVILYLYFYISFLFISIFFRTPLEKGNNDSDDDNHDDED